MYICFWCHTEIMNAFYLSDEKCDEKIQLFYCTRLYNIRRKNSADKYFPTLSNAVVM